MTTLTLQRIAEIEAAAEHAMRVLPGSKMDQTVHINPATIAALCRIARDAAERIPMTDGEIEAIFSREMTKYVRAVERWHNIVPKDKL